MRRWTGVLALAGGAMAVVVAAMGAARATPYTFTTIDVPGASAGTAARGINTAGQIVGDFTDSTGTHGFLGTGGSFTAINVPGAFSTEAMGINAAGQIVGFSGIGAHGFLDSGGSFTTIDAPGALATQAEGINDAGQIVGGFQDKTGTHGFLESSGNFTTIEVPGATATVAYGINAAGQIVGLFDDNTSRFPHGFLASPVAVPEPGSLALCGSGLVAFVLLRRRKSRKSPSRRFCTRLAADKIQ